MGGVGGVGGQGEVFRVRGVGLIMSEQRRPSIPAMSSSAVSPSPMPVPAPPIPCAPPRPPPGPPPHLPWPRDLSTSVVTAVPSWAELVEKGWALSEILRAPMRGWETSMATVGAAPTGNASCTTMTSCKEPTAGVMRPALV